MASKRIPISSFADFATCTLVGTSGGIRYPAFCEALENMKTVAPWPRQETVAVRGRAPGSVK